MHPTQEQNGYVWRSPRAPPRAHRGHPRGVSPPGRGDPCGAPGSGWWYPAGHPAGCDPRGNPPR
ncbi:ubiquinol oxidase [Ectothiorhodospira haloalkaliphila]|uniref:Ubiquinol oxidase n=1 Tax=Ectothiorhodospira haloalkaliphila TaxID=421628 RepID=W8KQX4_9GAMM|nr:ubiquinol oxidase [Ectothiorhodospira haloalkaliphila]